MLSTLQFPEDISAEPEHMTCDGRISVSVLTKKALAGAMKELLSTKPLSEIHVGDICGRCALSRKSMYYHFEDKYELVNWVFYSELIVRLEDDACRNIWDLLLLVTGYLHENRAFYHNAFQIDGDNCFRDFFACQLRPYIYAFLQLDIEGSKHFSVQEKKTAYAEFFADACVCSMEKWILHYPHLSPEEYVELFRI